MPPLGGRPRKLVKTKPKPGVVTFARPVKPKTLTQITTRAQRQQQVQQYKAQPVAARKVQLQSKGVLAPSYKSAAQTVHAQRQAVAKNPARAQKLAARQTAAALANAVHHQHSLQHISPPPGTGLAAVDAATRIASKAAPGVAAAAFPAATSALAALDKVTGAKTLKVAKTVVSSVPADAAELAVTTPSSIAKLATTAVHDPVKAGHMLVDPYVQAVEHPKEFLKHAETHPVSTGLMLAPVARLPGLAAGRVARLAGKQTLERPAAVFTGTPLREARTGSRDFLVRSMQARKDAKTGTPQIAEKQIQRRVDEFVHGRAQPHRQKVMQNAVADATQRAEKLPEEQRPVAIKKVIKGRAKGATKQVNRMAAEEFGSTWSVGENGMLLKPKSPDAKPVFHTTKEQAELVAERLPFDAKVLKTRKDEYAVVPKIVTERLKKHQVVGSSKATMAKVMRTSRRQFTQAVLPASLKWLVGQTTEAGLRSAVHGAGPTSFVRARKIITEMNRQVPGSGDALTQRAINGHFALNGPARDFAIGRKTLAEEFAGTSLQRPAAALTKAGAVPGVRHVRAGWGQYSRSVMGTVNGAIERTAQTAMLGKSIKNSPLMERHLIGLSDKAIHDAAQGLHSSEAQVELGRAVDRAYGKYAKFTPDMRSLLLHWTPFLPWFLNVGTFLLKVLPVDHPVYAGLAASVDAATEEWRKAHGLSLRGGKMRPDFLLGGYPVGEGGNDFVKVSRYLPFAPTDVTGAAGSLALPQFSGTALNLLGVDWKGNRLKHPGFKGKDFNQGERGVRALATALESQVPLVGQALAVTGTEQRYVDHKDAKNVPKFSTRVRKQFDPFKSTSDAAGKSKGSGWGGGNTAKKSGWG